MEHSIAIAIAISVWLTGRLAVCTGLKIQRYTQNDCWHLIEWSFFFLSLAFETDIHEMRVTGIVPLGIVYETNGEG